jgi:hypothetical protein
VRHAAIENDQLLQKFPAQNPDFGHFRRLFRRDAPDSSITDPVTTLPQRFYKARQ